ncbi:bone morphogenetic protein 1-like [Glandiceps talaboti]
MEVTRVILNLLILQFITAGDTASISLVLDNNSDDTTVKNKTNAWDTLPDVLKEIHRPNPRMFDPQSFIKSVPAMRRIEEENRVLQKIATDELFFEGDIYLGPKVQRNAIVYESSLWPQGFVPYEIDPAFDSDSVARIQEAMNQFHTHTCIRFVPRSMQEDYIYIYPGSGCWSYIGKTGGGGRQPLSLGNGCTYGRTTPMHEFMHAVGFAHEQSRTDRDNYVYIYTQNILQGQEGNFEKYGTDYIQDLGSSYDYYSIMHYHHTAFSIDGTSPTILPTQDGIRPEDLGSSLDFTSTDLFKLNALYNCDGDGDGDNNECVHAHELTSGNHVQITSSNYPENYGDNEDCTWTVTNSDGGNILLNFVNFDTESGYDYVQFGSGSSPDANAEKQTGNTAPSDFTSSGDTAWIYFHSDGSQTRSGFQLTATAVGGDGDGNQECGGTHELTSGNHVQITSSNYPENYGDNEDCTWTVTNSDDGNILLNFVNFDTESGYDYVQFGSGSSPDANAEKQTGNTAPSDFTSSDDTAWIYFHSDGSQTRSGFRMVATAVGGDGGTGKDCDAEHTLSAEESVQISSPNYPSNYDDNMDCTWIITNSDGGDIDLQFVKLETEAGYDYVQFGSGSQVDLNAEKYDGEEIPSYFTSSGSTLWIIFHSDTSNTRLGFQATVTAKNAGGGTVDCDAEHELETGSEIVVTTPNHPSHYDDNAHCTWKIRNTDGGILGLDFVAMDTEAGYDYVQFGSGLVSHPNAAKHDGTNLPADYNTEGAELWIVFHSDGSVNKPGFKAIVRAIEEDTNGGGNEVCGGGPFNIGDGETWNIQSPNYPSNYGDGVDCTWIFITSGENIQYNFNEMNTEHGYDYIQFGSGSSPDTNAEKHWGSSLPENFVSSGRVAWLTFHSDASINAKGFSLQVFISKDSRHTSNEVPLWTDDLRCGLNFPLSDGTPSQCNPDGIYPCCSPADWCGNTAGHCSCPGCIDYRGR